MRKLVSALLIGICVFGFVGMMSINQNVAYANNGSKIAQAKDCILNFVSHPNTVKFHDDSIEINKDIVTITITYTNGIGVTQNMTMNVKVEDK